MSPEDLERKPIHVFFKEGVLRRPELRPGFVFIAFSWPIAAFLVFLTVCSPHYKTTPLGVVVTAVFSLIGFAILYR